MVMDDFIFVKSAIPAARQSCLTAPPVPVIMEAGFAIHGRKEAPPHVPAVFWKFAVCADFASFCRSARLCSVYCYLEQANYQMGRQGLFSHSAGISRRFSGRLPGRLFSLASIRFGDLSISWTLSGRQPCFAAWQHWRRTYWGNCPFLPVYSAARIPQGGVFSGSARARRHCGFRFFWSTAILPLLF